ncbi:hypothetical protein IT568_09320 [bacterium]|nr:hypothetical protein [bacterium]
MRTQKSIATLMILSGIIVSQSFAQSTVNGTIVTPAQRKTELSAEKTPKQLRTETEEKVQAIHDKARAEILAISEQIKNLKDKKDEFELQKQVEKIKKQAEIDALKVRLDFFKTKRDQKMVDEVTLVIDRLENPEKYLPKPDPNIQRREPVTNETK